VYPSGPATGEAEAREFFELGDLRVSGHTARPYLRNKNKKAEKVYFRLRI
jgi:hypothetical protein